MSALRKDGLPLAHLKSSTLQFHRELLSSSITSKIDRERRLSILFLHTLRHFVRLYHVSSIVSFFYTQRKRDYKLCPFSVTKTFPVPPHPPPQRSYKMMPQRPCQFRVGRVAQSQAAIWHPLPTPHFSKRDKTRGSLLPPIASAVPFPSGGRLLGASPPAAICPKLALPSARPHQQGARKRQGDSCCWAFPGRRQFQGQVTPKWQPSVCLCEEGGMGRMPTIAESLP